MAFDFMKKMAAPGAKMSNNLMPRPSRSGSVIGPPKIKMPVKLGDQMPNMSKSMPKSSLGHNLSPLPKHPSLDVQGTPSLFHSRSPLQKIGRG